MPLLKIEIDKVKCDVTFISIMSKVFISIVVVSRKAHQYKGNIYDLHTDEPKFDSLC
jgi:hypothetical protein